jgi:hypothetical protein
MTDSSSLLSKKVVDVKKKGEIQTAKRRDTEKGGRGRERERD